MTLKKPITIIALIVTLCGVRTAEGLAQPSAFTAVSSDEIAKLESMHQQASDFLVKNDFDSAIRVYSDILLIEPDDETAYTGLGQIYMVLGQFKRAHEAFQNALHINPDNQVALVGIRQIMDPDGTEGMVSRQEAEFEPSPAPTGIATTAPNRIEPVFLGITVREKRQSASKAKKNAPPLQVAPVQTMAPRESRTTPRRIAPKVAAPRMKGRLGWLHAQRLQMALKNAGFYDGPVNGLIGPSTQSAVRSFQRHASLPTHGRMDTQTWARLTEFLEQR